MFDPGVTFDAANGAYRRDRKFPETDDILFSLEVQDLALDAELVTNIWRIDHQPSFRVVFLLDDYQA